MRLATYQEAIREAMSQEMRTNELVFILGEDIGVYGGAFGVTNGMIEEFGSERVRVTPISESAITGCAIGAAMTGMRPILEIQFSDFITIATDQIVNQAAKLRYMFGGKGNVPIVVRTPGGSGAGLAAQHSQSLEAWMTHIPGLKVIQPSTPYDAKGLLKAAMDDDNPVIFYEHKLLYGMKGDVPEEPYTIPLGKADIKREGTDVTIIATSIMVHKALEAAKQLELEGISVEVVDPRTLVPLDEETIIESVKKTGRAVVVHEAVKRGGYGAEIVSMIQESEAFDYLDAPIQRVAGLPIPIPYNVELEKLAVPQVGDIIQAVKSTLLRV
ncbi:pyruvate/2-oxoglutarate/acetoin dehydrogenase E1 component [Paenibacillus sp. V4I3]|uniref:alpha-ketoacid dehydrogenase subunit beta n=1 Tax=unclassified Paenibacillus TaxID=185978 RepID=UPI002781A908|nr:MULTISPECIES: alpha-ketoacid dehydrogenase subunit beta [unclassified Paenibacillus]MDQ0874417.1 pyruvate/2-oxoglutarate/acetoin dehydrogenase E1 component [Paenibacillus sp. V4I3]MDQ0889869.1 pyruvate/2-oxoglutarate/acetoin dehydrogenase E1 component [Paenibacillus sp. V4I9]